MQKELLYRSSEREIRKKSYIPEDMSVKCTKVVLSRMFLVNEDIHRCRINDWQEAQKTRWHSNQIGHNDSRTLKRGPKKKKKRIFCRERRSRTIKITIQESRRRFFLRAWRRRLTYFGSAAHSCRPVIGRFPGGLWDRGPDDYASPEGLACWTKLLIVSYDRSSRFIWPDMIDWSERL